jgi:hypothetical protein
MTAASDPWSSATNTKEHCSTMSPQDKPMPNLFLVGSMKSGTTTLHRYLKTHPEIFMTEDPKEPTYFLDRAQLLDVLPGLEKRGIWRSVDAYLELFEGAGSCPVVGEASANYARLHRVRGVPKRVADFNPGAKILFIARDPVERTVSNYWYMVRFFGERREMLEAVREDPDYIDTSYYAMQLKAWLEFFPRERVRLITLEALRNAPLQTMRGIFKWLCVDAEFVPPNLGDRANVAPSVLLQVKGSGLLHRIRHSAMWNAIGPLVPAPMRRAARSFSEETVTRDNTDRTAVNSYLRLIFSPQVDELATLLEREFPEWTSLYSE